jgi:hypothetical protein
MQRWFIARFRSESDHSRFLTWLTAWESEHHTSTDAKIGFVRADVFSRWTIHCSDEHFDALFNSVGGFNGVASME